MNYKILLIEDDQIVANVYRNKLLLDGFKAEVASDGEKGLEMIRSFRPDAVLLDLVLPKLSGVDIIRKVRQDADFKTLPLIVFTNTYLTSTVQDAWKAGATKCLAKADCSPNQVDRSPPQTPGRRRRRLHPPRSRSSADADEPVAERRR